MPFREDYSYEKKFSIDVLIQYFIVGGQIVLVKEIKSDQKKKQVDGININWGFKYEVGDNPEKLFYVEITKNEYSHGSIFSKNEYDNFANEIKGLCGVLEDNFYDLEHPDNGDSESFFVVGF